MDGAGFSSLALNLAVINYINYLLSWKVLTRYCDIACYILKTIVIQEMKGRKGVKAEDMK